MLYFSVLDQEKSNEEGGKKTFKKKQLFLENLRSTK